jgi:hypothetical protein
MPAAHARRKRLLSALVTATFADPGYSGPEFGLRGGRDRCRQNLQQITTFVPFLSAHQSRMGAALTALDRVAELCDWFGSESDVTDVARAGRLLAAEPTAG